MLSVLLSSPLTEKCPKVCTENIVTFEKAAMHPQFSRQAYFYDDHVIEKHSVSISLNLSTKHLEKDFCSILLLKEGEINSSFGIEMIVN